MSVGRTELDRQFTTGMDGVNADREQDWVLGMVCQNCGCVTWLVSYRPLDGELEIICSGCIGVRSRVRIAP
jgi:hypothetical protein